MTYIRIIICLFTGSVINTLLDTGINKIDKVDLMKHILDETMKNSVNKCIIKICITCHEGNKQVSK